MKELLNEPKEIEQAEFKDHAWKLVTLKQQIKKPKINWFLPCIIAVLSCALGVGQAIHLKQMDYLFVISPFFVAIGVLVSIESSMTKKRIEALLELLELEKETNYKKER